jgi:23S rRNA pseudouridine1911/1915/1917 synthase
MKQSPERRTFEVDAVGIRLDRYLVELCPDLTRSQLQKLIQNGNVTVNGLIQRSSRRIGKGDRLEICIPSPQPTTLEPEDIPFEVIYEDQDIAVINKPAGLAVYPGPGHSGHTLVNALLNRFPDLGNASSPLRPGIVHRLDKDTSGLMVIARTEKARQYLIDEFKSRAVNKVYLVLVQGRLQPEQGAIEAPIGRDPSDRKRMAIVSKGREARTDYRVIRFLGGYSLVEARILTGRTHQIRVHFSAIGHPVVGDSTYGVRTRLLNRQFLHACSLELNLPSTGQRQSFVSELPGDLVRAMNELGRK